MANSVDPDQMPHSVVSNLGLHCSQRPVCPIRNIMVYFQIERIITCLTDMNNLSQASMVIWKKKKSTLETSFFTKLSMFLSDRFIISSKHGSLF